MSQAAIENIISEVSRLSPDERRSLLATLTKDHAEKVSSRRSAFGKYAGRLTPVDEFLRSKHEETAREEAGK